MEVLVGNEAALLFTEAGHFVGDVSLVEIVPCGTYSLRPAEVGIGSLYICEALECAPEVGLDKYAADRGDSAIGHENLSSGGPSSKGAVDRVGIFQQASVGDGVHWKSVSGELEGRGNDFPEGLGPISFQGGEPGVGGGGYDALEDALGDFAAGVFHEVADVGSSGPAAQAANGDHGIRTRPDRS